jgi:hypothetical protein
VSIAKTKISPHLWPHRQQSPHDPLSKFRPKIENGLQRATKGAIMLETIFRTEDAALAQRIEQAIKNVARKRGANREK